MKIECIKVEKDVLLRSARIINITFLQKCILFDRKTVPKKSKNFQIPSYRYAKCVPLPVLCTARARNTRQVAYQQITVTQQQQTSQQTATAPLHRKNKNIATSIIFLLISRNYLICKEIILHFAC